MILVAAVAGQPVTRAMEATPRCLFRTPELTGAAARELVAVRILWGAIRVVELGWKGQESLVRGRRRREKGEG